MAWQPGDVVEHRHVKSGRVWWRTPARVIEDSDERTVLWWPAGTKYERVVAEGRIDHLRVLACGEWDLEPAEWTGGDALHVVLSGAPFSLWPFRTADHQMVGWYCNLQAPLMRTEVGFDTDDWTLDVVAATDLSSWSYAGSVAVLGVAGRNQLCTSTPSPIVVWGRQARAGATTCPGGQVVVLLARSTRSSEGRLVS